MDSDRIVPRSTWIRRALEAVCRFLMCGCGESGEDRVNLPVQETTQALETLINQSSMPYQLALDDGSLPKVECSGVGIAQTIMCSYQWKKRCRVLI